MRIFGLNVLNALNWKDEIKSFFIQRVTGVDRLVAGLTFLVFLLGCFTLALNASATRYPGFHYLPDRWLYLVPLVLAVLIFAMRFREKSPRLAFFTKTYCTYFFLAIAFAVLTDGIQFTPFPTIDHALLHADQFIGFNTTALMAWTSRHTIIKQCLEFVYEFLNVEMLLLPLALAWIEAEKQIQLLFITMLVSIFIGGLCYYFFPTSAPVSIIHNPYFLLSEHHTALKFYEIHHYLSVTTGDGGLIAFPSFHVVWCILLCYAVRRIKWLFYPLIGINALVIASTLLLGWHYLTDVFSGAILAIIAIVISKRFIASSNLLTLAD